MSVYSELVRVGIHDHEAGQIVESIQRNDNLATKLDLKELEAALAWKIGTLIIGALLGATAIFATVVTIIFNLSKLK
jgi:hypothetical protein